MNNKKICFIICENDSEYVEECLKYLGYVRIPKGYETDVLTVTEAESLAEGYREASEATDALIKVYLHQDVYITNSLTLVELARIFEDKLKSPDYNGGPVLLYVENDAFFASAGELPWEMLASAGDSCLKLPETDVPKANLTVIHHTPKVKWYFHDIARGLTGELRQWLFNLYRIQNELPAKEYGGFVLAVSEGHINPGVVSQIIVQAIEEKSYVAQTVLDGQKVLERQAKRAEVNRLYSSGQYDSIEKMVAGDKDLLISENDIAIMHFLYPVYQLEKKFGVRTVFEKVSSTMELTERFMGLKRMVRRFDEGISSDAGIIKAYLEEHDISAFELEQCIEGSFPYPEKTSKKIAEFLEKADCLANHEAPSSNLGKNDIQYGSSTRKADTENDKLYSDNVVNPDKIAFIICTNNRKYFDECALYIHSLQVPEGMEIDIVPIEGAVSMTSGYNTGMMMTDAKYKVYLHHDVYITNRDFIQKVIDIFNSDKKIGMIGMIGAPSIPENGVMWTGKRVGRVVDNHVCEAGDLIGEITTQKTLTDVEAIDGLMMITQYDLTWREDLFKRWDMYDCSQTQEFIRAGYRVVVPTMDRYWCIHDCGFLNMENYERQREKFIEEYFHFNNV